MNDEIKEAIKKKADIGKTQGPLRALNPQKLDTVVRLLLAAGLTKDNARSTASKIIIALHGGPRRDGPDR